MWRTVLRFLETIKIGKDMDDEDLLRVSYSRYPSVESHTLGPEKSLLAHYSQYVDERYSTLFGPSLNPVNCNTIQLSSPRF
jgi:hypothetical protein